jgi:DNA-directed RNA polymerase specialized sigma24 family protein
MITRARVIDRYRRNRSRPQSNLSDRETLLEPSGPGGTPDPFAQIRQQGAALHGAIERLTPLRRRLLVLAVSHGSSHEEIAAEAAFAVGTVKSHPRGALATIPAGISGVNPRRAPIGV